MKRLFGLDATSGTGSLRRYVTQTLGIKTQQRWNVRTHFDRPGMAEGVEVDLVRIC